MLKRNRKKRRVALNHILAHLRLYRVDEPVFYMMSKPTPFVLGLQIKLFCSSTVEQFAHHPLTLDSLIPPPFEMIPG